MCWPGPDNLFMGAMQEVQGHISQTDIDPGASTAWLRVQEGTLSATPGVGVSMRRVFNPFDWHLRHYSTAAQGTPQNGRAGHAASQSLVDRSKSHIYGSTSGAAAGSGGDEVETTSLFFLQRRHLC